MVLIAFCVIGAILMRFRHDVEEKDERQYAPSHLSAQGGDVDGRSWLYVVYGLLTRTA